MLKRFKLKHVFWSIAYIGNYPSFLEMRMQGFGSKKKRQILCAFIYHQYIIPFTPDIRIHMALMSISCQGSLYPRFQTIINSTYPGT
jgi:hypothetical protein